VDDMRRFEYTRGKSDKFWWVWTEPTGPTGYLLCCRWGRRGTDGQRKDWFHSSLNVARALAKDKANQKLAKGYFEVTASNATQRVCAECGDVPDTAGPLCNRCRVAARKKKVRFGPTQKAFASEQKPVEPGAVWLSPRRRLLKPGAET